MKYISLNLKSYQSTTKVQITTYIRYTQHWSRLPHSLELVYQISAILVRLHSLEWVLVYQVSAALVRLHSLGTPSLLGNRSRDSAAC